MRKVCGMFTNNLDDLRIRKECVFLLHSFPENVKSTSRLIPLTFIIILFGLCMFLFGLSLDPELLYQG